MSAAKLDTARELTLRARLYARPRSDVDLVREIGAATEALATTTRGWAVFLPRRAALEAAQHATIGLTRLLAELAAMQEATKDATG